MTDEQKILASNLTDTLKAIEKLWLAGLAAALGFLLLTLANPDLSGAGSALKIPLVGAEGPPSITASVMMLIYFVTGVLLFLYYRSAEQIISRLRASNPSLLDAVMTYPSIVTLSPVIRSMAILIIGLVGVAPLFLMTTREKAALVSLVLASPYLLLFGLSFWQAVKSYRKIKD